MSGHEDWDEVTYCERFARCQDELAGLRAERDEAQKLWRCGSQILRENTATLDTVASERDHLRCVNAELVEALSKAVRLYETYGLIANNNGCGEWVNSARDIIRAATETIQTKEPT